ncbi:MAG: hypothetical protein KGJ80_18655 [Chloroflexota bacterium]|nr:hypothetical protein [Chloroflexota bacterium]
MRHDPTELISHVNPLTCEVDALRALMVAGATNVYGIGIDFGNLILATTLLVTLAGRLYPMVVI